MKNYRIIGVGFYVTFVYYFKNVVHPLDLYTEWCIYCL
jgi:hypothetical protein